MIIVIDGPAGSGKSSTAKELARRHKIGVLDSGALYRAVTLLWLEKGKPEMEKFIDILTDTEIRSISEGEEFRVFLNEFEVTQMIRSGRVADCVSEIAAVPEIRSFVNNYMRNLVTTAFFIADGRDLGTAVFPDAELKFYMDASVEERTRRRFAEMQQKGEKITFDEVRKNLEDRDKKDRSRKADPLRKADDAIVVDTTGKTFEDQISEMSEIIEKWLSNSTSKNN